MLRGLIRHLFRLCAPGFGGESAPQTSAKSMGMYGFLPSFITGIAGMFDVAYQNAQNQDRKNELNRMWGEYYRAAIPLIASGNEADIERLRELNNSTIGFLQKGWENTRAQQSEDTRALMDQFKTMAQGLQTSYNEAVQRAGEGYRRLKSESVGEWAKGEQGINEGYADRYARNMATLAGLSDQEVRDTQEKWERERAAGLNDQIRRGLAGTTIAPTMNAAITREETADLNRVKDKLALQKIALDTALSGDALAARKQLMQGRVGLGANLGLAGLGANTQLDLGRLAAQERLGLGAVGLAENRANQALNLGLGESQQLEDLAYRFGSAMNSLYSNAWREPLALMGQDVSTRMGIESMTPNNASWWLPLAEGFSQGLQNVGGMIQANKQMQAAAQPPGWDWGGAGIGALIGLAAGGFPGAIVGAGMGSGNPYAQMGAMMMTPGFWGGAFGAGGGLFSGFGGAYSNGIMSTLSGMNNAGIYIPGIMGP